VNKAVIAAVLLSILLISTVFIILGQSPSYVEVSNLEMRYGLVYDHQHYNVAPVLDLKVKNTYSSDLINVGLTVNGQSHDTVYFLVPSKETRNMTFTLQSLSLISLKTYAVQVTFTFADGKRQSYSSHYTTPVFKGQIQILSTSLSLPNSSDNSSVGEFFYVEGVSVFHLNIQNTGNLPITKINVSFNNLNGTYSLEGIDHTILQNETANGWAWLWLGNKTTVFPATIQITYCDGSVSTVQANEHF
jgi:hypothetical protein